MPTAAIIGAGDIAGAAAHALAAGDHADRIVLVDAAGSAAAGKALDLQQSGAVTGRHARLGGTADETRIGGCDVCIIADRFGGAGEWHGEEGLALLARIRPWLGDAPLVFAGAAQAALIALAAAEEAVPPRRLIGSAPDALASAVRAMVALETGGSPGDVMLTVLGVPTSAFVVPWSEAAIGGYALERTLSPARMGRLQARAGRLWPPGPYALGAAAAGVAGAVLSNSRQYHAVLTLLSGEFGVRNRVGALPVRLGAGGIVDVRIPELSPREHVQLLTALGG